MPTTSTYHILSLNKVSNSRTIMTVMTYITDDEEQLIDAGKNLHLKRGDMTFNITRNRIYCYGNVDLTKGSSDYNIIEDFDFLDFLTDVGIHIQSDYDYNTHKCYSPIDRCRWTETWNPAEVAQFAHGSLNKPEKIVLFKHILDKNG